MSLLDDILAGGFDLQNRDDGAIAAALSAGRTQVVSTEIGDGAISLALGIPNGPVFIYQLETLANTPLAPDASVEVLEQHAVIRQSWRSIEKGAFDVGNPAVREGIDSFVGTLLTQTQADALKNLAVQPAPVSAQDVAKALEGH